MVKIPFKLEIWLKDKSQKVETGVGESVRILCTNAEGVLPIIGNVGEYSENLQRWTERGQYHVGINTPDKDLFIVTLGEETTKIREEMKEFIESEKQVVLCSESDGKACIKWDTKSIDTAIMLLKDGIDYLEKKKSFRPADCRYDYRFATHVDNIVTPEEKLTEFEKKLSDVVGYAISLSVAEPKTPTSEFVKEYAAELLELARTELTCQGNIVLSIEEFEKCFIEAQEKGRKEALKDLPRWEFYRRGTEIDPFAVVRFKDGKIGRAKFATEDCYVLEVKDMLKLPGFKED